MNDEQEPLNEVDAQIRFGPVIGHIPGGGGVPKLQ